MKTHFYTGTVRQVEPNNLRIGDVITNHGKTLKTVLNVKQLNTGSLWRVYVHGGAIDFDFDRVIHIKTDKMKTIQTHTMPADWASALINGDRSGLDYSGYGPEFDDYMQANPGYENPISYSDETTLERFTFYPGKTLLTECLVYSFLRG